MRKITAIVTTSLAFVFLLGIPLFADDKGKIAEGEEAYRVAPITTREHEIPKYFVPPPPFSEDIFPCSDCHDDMDVNPQRRVLEEFHEDIEFKNHDEANRWCLDCHNANDRDVLRLLGGKLVKFEESYILCGQCHGTIFRDWKAGIHGKRTGEWNGQKLYRLCVECHDPHQPRFKPLKPLPPPIKPAYIK